MTERRKPSLCYQEGEAGMCADTNCSDDECAWNTRPGLVQTPEEAKKELDDIVRRLNEGPFGEKFGKIRSTK